MEFLDYEKVIRDHYPMLIESYVRQYGENYRKRITEVLERAKYCIFVTPSNIKEYVDRKSNEDYMKALKMGVAAGSASAFSDNSQFPIDKSFFFAFSDSPFSYNFFASIIVFKAPTFLIKSIDIYLL